MTDLERAANALAAAMVAGLRKMGQSLIIGTLVVAILLASVALYVILNEWINLLPMITGAFQP